MAPRADIVCYRCGQKGHFKKDCTSKKKRTGKRGGALNRLEQYQQQIAEAEAAGRAGDVERLKKTIELVQQQIEMKQNQKSTSTPTSISTSTSTSTTSNTQSNARSSFLPSVSTLLDNGQKAANIASTVSTIAGVPSLIAGGMLRGAGVSAELAPIIVEAGKSLMGSEDGGVVDKVKHAAENGWWVAQKGWMVGAAGVGAVTKAGGFAKPYAGKALTTAGTGVT